MVPDPGWFDSDQTKFKDWWKEIQLFLKRNRVIGTDDRITMILAYLKGGIAGIYAQKKLNKLDKEINILNWKEFIGELKMIFSNRSKAADAEQKIKKFRQGKKHIANFIIEFEALAMKAETDDLHVIFLLKKNVQIDIIKMMLGYPPMITLETLKKWKVAITSVEQEYKSTESQKDYRIGTGTTYRGREIAIDIGKSRDNFNKDGKLRCFNCNIYRHMVKEY